MKKLSKLINSYNIDLYMYLGSHDKIITQKGMQRLLQHVSHYKVHIAESGHNKLIEKVAEHLEGQDSKEI